MHYPNFIGGSYTSQHATADTERLVNWYVERSESSGSKAPAMLLPTPGVTAFHSSGGWNAPVRGMFALNGRAFGVLGERFYEFSSTGAATGGHSMTFTDTSPAYFASNGDGGEQLLVTSCGTAWVYNLSTLAFNRVNTLGSFVPSMAAMLDGFVILLDATVSAFQISALNDASTWEGGIVTVYRSTAPDRWVSMVVAGKELYLLGMSTSDVYYNAGSSPMPFVPHPSGVIPFGCVAPYSAQSAGDSVIWLSQTAHGHGQAVLVSGMQARVISPPALVSEWSGYSTIADAEASVHTWNGHTFYVLTFPTADKTWVYDLTTGVWHERGTWDADAGDYVAWRPLHACFCFGKHLVGDRNGSVVYELDPDSHTDVTGSVLRRVRRAPVLSDENRRLRFAAFELDLEVGLGTTSGQGSAPTITLRLSNDGGKTWLDCGDRSVGAQGEYQARPIWRRLGSARNRVFEIVATDPIPWRITDAYLTFGAAA